MGLSEQLGYERAVKESNRPHVFTGRLGDDDVEKLGRIKAWMASLGTPSLNMSDLMRFTVRMAAAHVAELGIKHPIEPKEPETSTREELAKEANKTMEDILNATPEKPKKKTPWFGSNAHKIREEL